MIANCSRSRAIALLLLLAGPAICMAQTYPGKPIRIVVPSPGGSTADIVTRTISNRLAERVGVQVVADPRPGASGVIACEIVAKAAPDGYTLLLSTSASHGINVSLYPKLPYDAVRDFASITLVAQMPLVVAVHPSVPSRKLQELIALAKARPGQLVFASSGSGTTTHLAAELLKLKTGIDFLHVPYKGSQPALIETLSGRAGMNIAPILTALPHVRSGRLRGLAVTTAVRSPTAPDVPTVAESGLPGYEATLWYGLSAPAAVPRDIIARLNQEVVAVLGQSEVRESLRQQGADAAAGSAAAFDAYIKSEIAKWGEVVRASGARPE